MESCMMDIRLLLIGALFVFWSGVYVGRSMFGQQAVEDDDDDDHPEAEPKTVNNGRLLGRDDSF